MGELTKSFITEKNGKYQPFRLHASHGDKKKANKTKKVMQEKGYHVRITERKTRNDKKKQETVKLKKTYYDIWVRRNY